MEPPRIRTFDPFEQLKMDQKSTFEQLANHVVPKYSNILFWSIFKCSNGPKSHFREVWSHVIINFGEKISGPKSKLHAYASTWSPPSYTFLDQNYMIGIFWLTSSVSATVHIEGCFSRVPKLFPSQQLPSLLVCIDSLIFLNCHFKKTSFSNQYFEMRYRN